ncbi:MAG: endonuclease/exonuclease/phosphatase family protein [Alphaproteobacteria bacterium]|nr:endonuclease/exonuclease/phosphatase family protein [Alphaproteobacteria bacterium]
MSPRIDPDLTVLERPRLARETCPDLAAARVGGKAQMLHRIECGGLPSACEAQAPLRVVFWNVERGHAPEDLASFLIDAGADVALLCELDHGLARTGRRHVARDISHGMDVSYAYAVEFLELDEVGEPGLHGNAVLSRATIRDPLLIRLAEDTSWMTRPGQQRRLGSRIALAGRIAVEGLDVVLVSTHLESHAGPDERARQMCALLDAVDGYAGDAPVLIGGDFNTRTASKDAMRDAEARNGLYERVATAFVDPAPWEPLFDIARAAGYSWSSANLDLATERSGPDDPRAPRFRLDWFFARGLECHAPGNLCAETGSGGALSDHDAIYVEIRVPDRRS